MHKFTLTYEYFGSRVQKAGEVAERIDAYELLFNLLKQEGKPIELLARNSGGAMSYQESLERTRFRNARVSWH